MKITWLGHACFRVEANGYSVIIDPYTGVSGYRDVDESADMVLCSHGHGDHSFTQGVKLREGGICPFVITRLESFHDDCGGQKRGPNIIHVLDFGGLRAAHLGDLGHELDKKTVAVLGQCHAVMAPIGGYYTIDAATAKKIKDALDCRAFIPMHYRFGENGPKVIGTLDDFLPLVGDVERYPGNCIEVTPQTEVQTAVLQYIPAK